MLKVNDAAIWDSIQFGKGTELLIQGFSPNQKVARVSITKAGNTGKPVKATTHALVKALRPKPAEVAPKKTAVPRKRTAKRIANINGMAQEMAKTAEEKRNK